MFFYWLLLQASMPAARVVLSATFKSPSVTESSGVVVSRARASVLWTHNDSGDGPYLYATDSAGNDHGAVRVSGAEAIDWEDLASGPCPRGRGPCIYIADTGDNLERRKSVTLYAVPEPEPPVAAADTQRVTAAASVVSLRYPDGAHDVEAIYVSPRDSAVYLVSKGRGGSVVLYRVARTAWGGGVERVVTAERLQTLPIAPNRRLGRVVTGAAVRADGAVVAIRTYVEIYFFRPGPDGRLQASRRPGCSIAGVDQTGEAIAFRDDSTLVLTSEASRIGPGTIRAVRCPC